MTGRLPLAATLALVGLVVSACDSATPPVGAEDRLETRTTLEAAIVALSGAVRGGRPPLRVRVGTLERLGVEVPDGVSIGAFERRGRGISTAYKLCLLHEHGYWVAGSYPVSEQRMGEGELCGVSVGEEASPAAG